MKIAYTMMQGRGDMDRLLAGLAGDLAARGLRVAGTVQVNTDRRLDGVCDMDIRVLPDGPVFRVSQDLGKESHGCRLDPAALELAVAAVSARLPEGADLMIVNKFGKHEAMGRGFREVMAEALAQEIPVLVGVNALNLQAFQEFSGGLAKAVAPDPAALLAWVEENVRQTVGT